MSRIRKAVSRAIILGTVSGMTLLAATNAEARTDLGTLRAQDKWQVGTVETGSLSYCAMMNKYDNQAVLAFARNPDGFGSVALDFKDDVFDQGREYNVALKPSAGAVRDLKGRATSGRSIVVQLGDDKNFFNGLAGSGSLDVVLPGVQASFALRQFGSSYSELVRCADTLVVKAPAVKVGDVEQTQVSALDQQMADIADDARENTAKAVVTPPVGEQLAQLDAELSQKAATSARQSGEKIAALDQRVKELEQQIATQKQQAITWDAAPKVAAVPVITVEKTPEVVAAVEGAVAVEAVIVKSDVVENTVADVQQSQTPARTLLATTGGSVAVKSAEATPAAAALDRAEVVTMQNRALLRAGEMKKVEAYRAGLVSRQKELDVVAAQRDDKTEEHVAAFNKEDTRLNADIVKLEKERAVIEAKIENVQQAASVSETENRKLKASLVSKQAQIAELTQAQAAAEDKLTQKLAETHTGYEARIAELTQERDAYKTQLDAALARNTELVQFKDKAVAEAARADEAQARLAVAGEERADLLGRIGALERQNKLMQASLTQKAGAAGETAALQDKIAKMEANHAAAIARLQEELTAKTTELAQAGQGGTEELVAARAATSAAQKQLAEKQALITQMEEQLQAVEAARKAEIARAESLQAELADARKQIATLRDQVNANVTAAMAPVSTVAPVVAAAEQERTLLSSATSSPATPEALAAIEPVAGDATPALTPDIAPAPVVEVTAEGAAPAPKKKKGFLWGLIPRGYDKEDAQEAPLHKERVGHADAQMPPPVFDAGDQTAQTVQDVSVPVTPAVSRAPAPRPDNRAAAFLEKIMAHHRADGVTVDVQDDVRIAEMAPIVSAVPVAQPTLRADAPVPAALSVDDALSVRDIQPAAGQAEQAIVAPAAIVPQPVTLEALLDKAELANAQVAETDGVKQWTAGNLSGMHEQLPATGAFTAQVQRYIDRYRADCGESLQVRIGAEVEVPAGRLAQADISCAMKDNSYVSSFVFLQDAATFQGVLHTALPENARAVEQAGQRVADVLSAAGGLHVAGTAVSGVPSAPYRFHIPAQDTGHAPSAGQHDFETVVVQ
ncbi:MAG: hypothetical protein OXT65_06220 [Alphaproteobacteria bacterium]|nr:hypothetical protein [Alphaproteobacteria bacterium]